MASYKARKEEKKEGKRIEAKRKEKIRQKDGRPDGRERDIKPVAKELSKLKVSLSREFNAMDNVYVLFPAARLFYVLFEDKPLTPPYLL